VARKLNSHAFTIHEDARSLLRVLFSNINPKDSQFMSNIITVEAFLKKAKTIPVVDVRTPAEFEQGHLPGAINLPIFTNEERALVGTKYKRASRESAIILGLELVGPKLAIFVKRAKKIAPGREILILSLIHI